MLGMRRRSRVLLAVLVASCAALGSAVAAQAAGSGSITTGPSAEAWHRTAPVCALPPGCPTAPSPYAPDTLHIGVNAGMEEARTALQLDLSALPAGTKPAGGQLRLPVAAGPRDGTRSAETAKLQACLVTQPVQDVDGSFEAAPKADCEAASVDAVFVPGTVDAPPAFTVDLAAIATAWEDSPVPGAIALVPSAESVPTDSWHIALSDRTREGDGVAKVTAAILFVTDAFQAEQDQPTEASPFDTGFSEPMPFDSTDNSFSAGGLAYQAPVAFPPAQAPATDAPGPQVAPPQAVPVASFIDARFQYPAVFLLPLLFAVAAAWLGRAMTRDLSVA